MKNINENKQNKIKKIKNFNNDQLYKKQIKSFLNNVKKRTQPKNNLEESYRLLDVIIKIKNNKNNKF